MNKLWIVFLFSFWYLAQAQDEPGVVPHYPTSGFIAGRPLPFVVTGLNGVEVLGVSIRSGPSCSGDLVDAENLPDHFFLLCEEPSVVTADVRFRDDTGRNFVVPLINLVILQENEPDPPEEGGDG
ncbi:MAG: hypothetical protein AAF203_01500 [Pseudomonadota bacterium]